MPTIGRFAFVQWRIAMPRVRRPKIRLAPRPGVIGNVIVRGFRRIETASGWTAGLATPLSGAQQLIDDYTELAASTNNVRVVDQFGRVYTDVIVMDVRADLTLQINGVYRVDAFWTLDVGF